MSFNELLYSNMSAERTGISISYCNNNNIILIDDCMIGIG